MEQNRAVIKNNLNSSDITYMSELTPPFWQWQVYLYELSQKSGVNSHNNLLSAFGGS